MRAKKIIRRLAWTAIALATLVALFYAEEDWRGARAWQAMLQQMRLAGEPLTLRELIPPGAPQADLSKTPLFADKNPEIAKIFLPRDGKAPRLASITPLREINLAAWQHYFRSQSEFPSPSKPGPPAEDVLFALKKFDPLFAQADSALRIPGAYFPVVYDSPFTLLSLQSVTSQINVARVMQLRSLAHLDADQREAARDDFIFLVRLEAPARRRGFLVDLLVNIAEEWISLPVLWEGLHRHAWKDDDLQEMERALQSHDFIGDFRHCLRAERLGAFQEFASIGRMRSGRDYIWPSGWLYQRFAVLGQVYPIYLGGIHPEKGTIDKLPSGPIQNAAQKVAQAETYRRLACVACEVERYYLMHQAYPDQLGDLTGMPPHLNQEVLSMRPFHYQNLGQTYRLYSVGWNGKDDDGRYHAADPARDDWPWPDP